LQWNYKDIYIYIYIWNYKDVYTLQAALLLCYSVGKSAEGCDILVWTLCRVINAFVSLRIILKHAVLLNYYVIPAYQSDSGFYGWFEPYILSEFGVSLRRRRRVHTRNSLSAHVRSISWHIPEVSPVISETEFLEHLINPKYLKYT
jgi:hypothetical protein